MGVGELAAAHPALNFMDKLKQISVLFSIHCTIYNRALQMSVLALLHSERPKLYTVLACLSAVGLKPKHKSLIELGGKKEREVSTGL